MPSNVKGYPGATRVSSEIAFDPSLGDGVTEIWEGPRQAIMALYRVMRALGYRCTARQRGARWQFTIFIGRTEENEAAASKYQWDKDFFQVSVFSLPWVAAEADKYVTRAQYRKDLEDAVKSGKDNPLDTNQFPFSKGIYEDLSRGIEAYEIERVVLRRVRTFSIQFADRIVLQALPVVYKSETLISKFEIPKVIADQFPANPPADQTPSGTVWAWKTRHDSSDQIPYLNKVQEIKEWVFAAWSTHYYLPL